MRLLCLDLSSSHGSVALRLGDNWEELTLGTAHSHSEKVIDAIIELLRRHQVTLLALDGWVTTTGPGSFTGLRIAMATLKAFSLACPKPIHVLSGSEARALQWRSENPKRNIKEIKVLTTASAGKHTEEIFSFSTEGETIEINEKDFPLKANYLGKHFGAAKTKKSFHSVAQWIALTPQYFGDTRFIMSD